MGTPIHSSICGENNSTGKFTVTRPKVGFGVILAGGKGSRMQSNRDKPLMELDRRALIDWVVESGQHQVEQLLLNVNSETEHYQHLSLPQFADIESRVSGPLTGIVSAMQFVLQHYRIDSDSDCLACFAADVPSFPDQLVKQLQEALAKQKSDVAIAYCDDQIQPLFSLWKYSCLPVLENALDEGLFGPKMVLPRLQVSRVDFPNGDVNGIPYFTNINSLEDLSFAQKLINSSS